MHYFYQKRYFKIVLSTDNYGEYCISAQSNYLKEQRSMDVRMELHQIIAPGFIKTICLRIMCQLSLRLQQPPLYDQSSICSLKPEVAVVLSSSSFTLSPKVFTGTEQRFVDSFKFGTIIVDVLLKNLSASFIQIQKQNHHKIFSSVLLCYMTHCDCR